MDIVLFFVRAGENPLNEWVLYEAVDQSDTAWDERNGTDRVDELLEYFEEKYPGDPLNMWQVITLKDRP